VNPDNGSDLELRAIAQRLGVTAAERIDVEATAARVLERLRAEPEAATPRSRAVPLWLRLAAAVAVVVMGVWFVVSRASTSGDSSAQLVLAYDLSDLSASQLQDLLGTLDQTLTLAVPDSADRDAGLEELTEQQLRTVIESLEG
jgi:hypothetical protein